MECNDPQNDNWLKKFHHVKAICSAPRRGYNSNHDALLAWSCHQIKIKQYLYLLKEHLLDTMGVYNNKQTNNVQYYI